MATMAGASSLSVECAPGFDCRNTRTLFSFFLCRLKLRYAFLQNGNSAFEVIYCSARRVKFLLVVGRIFRNQFLEKVYVALQATCSTHHAFFHRADFHARNILCACGTASKRDADGKNQRLQHQSDHATRRRHQKRRDLAGSGSARSATVAASAQRSRSWRVASSWPRKSSPTWRRPAISASRAAVAW